nr:hypothetical protein GCM10020185_28960 [Pseudomonas brassicacearum subsp. brassicacearum]
MLDGVMSQSETQLQNLWKLREYISETISHWTPYKNDISVTVSKVPGFLREIDAIVGEHYPDFEIVWFGHIGDGNLHLNILKPENLSKDEFFAKCATVNKWVFETVEKYNGSISAEHGVGMTKRDYLTYSRSPVEIEYMKAVKAVFDPNGIMNPGKIFRDLTPKKTPDESQKQESVMSYQHQYVDGTRIHFPVGKVVCIGRNYAEHAKELDNPVPTEPLLFIKPGSCVVPLEGGFSIPADRGSVHYEAEIAVLIGKPLSTKPSVEEVLDAISGFAPALDLTLRDKQAELKAKGLPWEVAKSFDGAAVLAPFVSSGTFADLTDIPVRLTINGEVRQDGNSSLMLNPIVPMIQYMAGCFSLQAGDVILTGTPAGVGPLNAGDELVLELPGASRFESSVR